MMLGIKEVVSLWELHGERRRFEKERNRWLFLVSLNTTQLSSVHGKMHNPGELQCEMKRSPHECAESTGRVMLGCEMGHKDNGGTFF